VQANRGITMAKKKKKSAKSKSSAKSKKSTTPLKPNKTIGILHSGSDNKINNKSIKAFLDELANNGYKVNQNLILDPKSPLFSNDDPGLLATNATTLAGNSWVNLIIAAGGPPSVYCYFGRTELRKDRYKCRFHKLLSTAQPCLEHDWCRRPHLRTRPVQTDSTVQPGALAMA